MRDPARAVETTTALQKEIAARHPHLNYQAHYIYQDAQGAFTQWKTLVSGHGPHLASWRH